MEILNFLRIVLEARRQAGRQAKMRERETFLSFEDVKCTIKVQMTVWTMPQQLDDILIEQ
jgi:predicted nucleic acid-binding OB-fold protein